MATLAEIIEIQIKLAHILKLSLEAWKSCNPLRDLIWRAGDLMASSITYRNQAFQHYEVALYYDEGLARSLYDLSIAFNKIADEILRGFARIKYPSVSIPNYEAIALDHEWNRYLADHFMDIIEYPKNHEDVNRNNNAFLRLQKTLEDFFDKCLMFSAPDSLRNAVVTEKKEFSPRMFKRQAFQLINLAAIQATTADRKGFLLTAKGVFTTLKLTDGINLTDKKLGALTEEKTVSSVAYISSSMNAIQTLIGSTERENLEWDGYRDFHRIKIVPWPPGRVDNQEYKYENGLILDSDETLHQSNKKGEVRLIYGDDMRKTVSAASPKTFCVIMSTRYYPEIVRPTIPEILTEFCKGPNPAPNIIAIVYTNAQSKVPGMNVVHKLYIPNQPKKNLCLLDDREDNLKEASKEFSTIQADAKNGSHVQKVADFLNPPTLIPIPTPTPMPTQTGSHKMSFTMSNNESNSGH